MLPLKWLCGGLSLLGPLANASKAWNYSVQLMEGLAPAGWSSKQWAAAADSMIGKTQAYILTDLIEELAIKLKITDRELRNQIDSDRTALGLERLRPSAQKQHFSTRFQNRHRPIEDPDHISIYLPPGWTERKLESHTKEEVAELPPDVQERLALRLAADLADEEFFDNPGILEQFSDRILRNISNTLHEFTRKAHGLPPGVRAYKRNIAPLVALISLQGFDNFGFVMYRTSYSNQTAFLEFMDSFDEVMTAQKENTLNGDGLEQIEEMFMMPIQDEESFEGATADECRRHFKELRVGEFLPHGLDHGALLLVNEQVISSFLDVSFENLPYLWVVDVDFDPKKTTYPEGYEGILKARPAALLHDLYLALGSGVMAPVDIWKVLRRKNFSEEDANEKPHDEL